MYWSVQVCTDKCWSVQVCTDKCWSVQVCACLHWSVLDCTDLDDLLEGVQVLLHAVVQPQVGDEVTGEHPVQTVEQRVHTCMEVDQVSHRHMTCRSTHSQSEESNQICSVLISSHIFRHLSLNLMETCSTSLILLVILKMSPIFYHWGSFFFFYQKIKKSSTKTNWVLILQNFWHFKVSSSKDPSAVPASHQLLSLLIILLIFHQLTHPHRGFCSSRRRGVRTRQRSHRCVVSQPEGSWVTAWWGPGLQWSAPPRRCPSGEAIQDYLFMFKHKLSNPQSLQWGPSLCTWDASSTSWAKRRPINQKFDSKLKTIKTSNQFNFNNQQQITQTSTSITAHKVSLINSSYDPEQRAGRLFLYFFSLHQRWCHGLSLVTNVLIVSRFGPKCLLRKCRCIRSRIRDSHKICIRPEQKPLLRQLSFACRSISISLQLD